MNRKVLTRTTTIMLSLILLCATIFSLALPVFGQDESVYNSSYIKDVSNNVSIDASQYYDGGVVQQLPSTVKDNDEISVIVTLDNSPLLDAYNQKDRDISFAEYVLTDEAKEIEEDIACEKATIIELLKENNVDFQAGVDYSVLLSGFEIILKAKDFELACQSFEGKATAIVSEVYNVSETRLVENSVNVYETGIFDSSSYKYDGTGMTVAVLDTGLDYTHSAFSIDNFTADRNRLGLTRDMVALKLNKTKAAALLNGLSVDDVYLNDKVPFSFDYADQDADVYSLHNNHGTHVSGVIVGKDDTITGVAPNAQLVSMKIFSDIQDSAKASWILDALEDCVILDVDVINMSLGTACGFSRESDKEAMTGVYDKIRNQGISLVVAASNSFTSSYGSEKNGNLGLTSNPDTATVGSPSTYEGAMSVASINGVKTPYILYNGQIIYFVESTNSAAKERNFVEDLLSDSEDEKEYEYVLVPGAGRNADYTGMDVKGKIVLVERGSNTFEEKANVAARKGAAGIIIFNNVSGDIKMNVGTSSLAVCSISQKDGEVLAAAGSGTITVSRSQASGPFMSDFSSWGPSPSLGIKPEITAHGGNILSSITGGGYDRLSGTSMACPNLAGVTILLRQYVTENYDKIIGDGETNEYKRDVNINATVNRLMMSTADIIYNKNGLPYAVRKQGAGLANLTSATVTKAYILTHDRLTGEAMDKTKIELGDDPEKTGVYTLNFSVVNFGTTYYSYDISAYVMTEGVSDVKTHQGETTVTEEGYLLEGAGVDIKVKNGTLVGNNVTVPAGGISNVTVTITLTEENKKYIDESFENGMYVEGFVTLTPTWGTDISLNVPYLAFYGDWTQAPLFDLDYFETNADELNDNIPTLDKTLPDAYATRPIGGIEEDYVSYLGSYYFLQNPNNKVISASRDYIAISNTEGTIHSIRFIWAGMLRNASKIEVTITDDQTGEVVFETVEKDVRKSYGDGGSYLYPANVDVEFDAKEHNLKNNTKYTVKVVGYLDYENDGLETNQNNTFEFPFTTDFEAPAITGCEFYTEYDKDLEKNRLYARMAIYDNHYSMAAQIGYVDKEYNFVPFSSYMTPIYSEYNGISYVEVELTDYIFDIKNDAVNLNSIVVACYDYALNDATYEIGLPDEFEDFFFETEEVVLSPNELYNLTPDIYPETEWTELLKYHSTNENVAIVVNNKVIALNPGVTRIFATDPVDHTTTSFKLTVLSEDDEGYVEYDKPVADEFTLIGYDTIKAYYIVDSNEREIGVTGDVTIFPSKNYSITLYPSESVKLKYKLDAYFPDITSVIFESNDDSIVTISEDGTIVAVDEGYSSVSVKVLLNGKSTYYSQTVSIEVKDPYVTTAPTLTHYYGNGGVVEIPESLLLTEIGQFAFSNFDYVPKESWELDPDDPSTSKMWYIGENTITKVIIPEGVKKINPYAFANLTALEEVVLPSTMEAIEYGAFLGCVNLKKVEGLEYVQLINKDAFAYCNLEGTISLDNACAIGDYAFAENGTREDSNEDGIIDMYDRIVSYNLVGAILPEKLQSIGGYAFYHNESLTDITVNAEKVKYGPYVFAYCTSLKEIKMNANVIPEGAFLGCTSLENVVIGKDVSTIGEFAFTRTNISSFNLVEENNSFIVSENGDYVLSADGTTLLFVSPTLEGEFSLDNANVTRIGKGAFAYNSKLTSINIPSVTAVGANAFAYCTKLENITLGELTEIGDYAYFRTGITQLPSFNNIKELGAYAFAYTRITSVDIPENMVVGEGAFSECKEIKSVTIGDNAVLGLGAFMLARDNNYNTEELKRDPNYSQKVYYYELTSKLKSLTIGKNVVIGDSAFMGASKLESVTLGDGATLGAQAFYNTPCLKSIDLSKVKSIGDRAFSGDILYTYSDQGAQSVALDANGYYIYHYYSAPLTEINLSSLTFIGEDAFSNCHELTTVTLGKKLTEISANAFMNCTALTSINLENVKVIGLQAFAEAPLVLINLSSCEVVGNYAFVNCKELTTVVFGTNGAAVNEGAFAYAESLTNIENLDKVKSISAYAFAYTALTSADLSSCVSIGDWAFLKESLTDFEVTLGDALQELGDNPFAMCKLAPFSQKVEKEFNGKVYVDYNYSFDISENVIVIDGSLYQRVPLGLELITFAGTEVQNVKIADETVRISAMAFAGSDVVRVTLSEVLNSIGHKAFYDCDKLVTVIFRSYEAPVLEEEFDSAYYDSFENLPATGDYEFTDYNGNILVFEGLGIVPYYMWNVSDGKYSNAYYGASFVNQIGHGNPELVMVRPTNGLYYETFIYSQYFTTVVDGIVAKQDATLEAIEAISKLPAKLTLEDEEAVIHARKLYDIAAAINDQKALITNYSTLVSAESTILALKSLQDDDTTDGEAPDGTAPEDGTDNETNEEEKNEDSNSGLAVIIVVVSCVGAVLLVALVIAIALIVASIKTQASISVIIATFIMKRMQKRLLKKLAKQAKKMEKEQQKAIKKAEKAEKKSSKKSKKALKEDVVVEEAVTTSETNENE
ncbi:MAG: leucine-rich repeat protein [Clostridia bacterium]|nr:leucine-rich repeat protein [Clostridia bacterium]